MELQKQNNGQSLQISQEVQEVGKAIYHVNQLTPFNIDDEMILSWSKSIFELIPNIEINDLKDLISDFKTDEIHYDNKLGIQNIFIGLKIKYATKYFKPKMRY